MNAPLNNPHLFNAKYGKVFVPKAPGSKLYVAHVGHGTRRWFKTATKAKEYAERVLIRWRRLYDAAIAAMSQQVEAA